MAFSTAGPGAPQMNVTPLIDVLLVLLVIFMLVVIQEKKYGLEAQIPEEAKQTDHTIPGPDRTIVIQVRDGKSAGHPEVKINEEAVSWDRLRDRLIEIYAGRIEKVAFVKADDDLDFQPIADVIDTAHNVGIDRVGLLHEETAAARDHAGIP
jgi:biopolymer transport protein TolR